MTPTSKPVTRLTQSQKGEIMSQHYSKTPWGAADHVDTITEGITHVMTPSHGGIHLSPERNALVPAYMKRDGAFASQRRDGWYEEDCDWCIPYIVFEHEFRMRDPQRADETMQMARDTLLQWHSEAAMEFYKPEQRA